MDKRYICYNGSYFRDEETVISHRNRSFAYGDALFETIHCLGTEPQSLDKHWARLEGGMKKLKMEPGNVISEETLAFYIGKLLNKNRIFKGARVRLVVFRNEGGLYAPATNSVSWTMESSPLESEQFTLNLKGLAADIFDEVHKPVNPLSNYKTANALVYVLAGIFRNENELDECFILNQFGRIAETNHSNVFAFLEDVLITPPLSEGCVAGTMRSTVIDLARREGINVLEKGLLERNILEAEEVFITNAIQGIQWIGAYKEKRYFNFIARRLTVSLNEEIFSK